MRLLTPTPDDDKFYIKRPYFGHGFDTLVDARCHAGLLQFQRTCKHSIQIFRNGECVSLKRY